MDKLKGIGIVLIILGVTMQIFEGLSTIGCGVSSSSGALLILIGWIIISYSLYKNSKIMSKLDAIFTVILIIIVFLIIIFFMSISTLCIPPSYSPIVIDELLTKAYNHPGTSYLSTTKVQFKNLDEFSSDSFGLFGNSTIAFECSSELSDVCSGGNTLTITKDFIAQVSACCNTQNQCKVKIGEETVTC
jgi:uncharacterized membrane protein